MPNVLFVCTANLYRSPLAAALFYRKLQDTNHTEGWVVESAGTWAIPDQSVPQSIQIVTRGMNLDLRKNLSRQVNRDLLTMYDVVIVMEKGHKEALGIEFPFVREKLHLLSEIADGLAYDIADPGNSDLSMDAVTAEMSRLIDRAYPTICRLAQANQPADL